MSSGCDPGFRQVPFDPLMMLQRFAVLLMMCRIPAPMPGDALPGVRVRDDIPQRSPI